MAVGQKCVQYLMFFFNLLFTITGFALIVAGGIAQSHYKSFRLFLSDGTVSAPALLIVVGVFIFMISFLGCCGAIRQNYHMLIGFAILLGFVLILQISGGIAGYVQKENLSKWLDNDLTRIVNDYSKNTNATLSLLLDQVQEQQSCCGSNNFTDYKNVLPGNLNTTKVPQSCCKLNKQITSCNRSESYLNDNCLGAKKDPCPIFSEGCQAKIEKILKIAISGAIGVAFGLAFIQLIGIVFACFLAQRIRSGYTYA